MKKSISILDFNFGEYIQNIESNKLIKTGKKPYRLVDGKDSEGQNVSIYLSENQIHHRVFDTDGNLVISEFIER